MWTLVSFKMHASALCAFYLSIVPHGSIKLGGYSALQLPNMPRVWCLLICPCYPCGSPRDAVQQQASQGPQLAVLQVSDVMS